MAACHTRRRSGRLRACGALGVVLGAAPAAADTVRDFAEVGTATLTVARADGATGCAGARALAEQLVPLIEPPPADAPHVAIDVTIDHALEGWVADVVVRGTTEQVLKLRAPGTDCSELERRLTALLVDVHDRSVTEAELKPAARTEREILGAPEPVTQASKAPEVDSAGENPGTKKARAFSAFFVAGAGITLGVAGEPLTYFFGSFALEHAQLALFAGGYTTLDAREELGSGSVEVSWTGGIARPCLRFLHSGRARAWGCGALTVASLRAEAYDYPVVTDDEHRPYFAAGAGMIGVVDLDPFPLVGFEATVTAPLRRLKFSVEGVGVAYETPVVGSWFGASLGARFW